MLTSAVSYRRNCKTWSNTGKKKCGGRILTKKYIVIIQVCRTTSVQLPHSALNIYCIFLFHCSVFILFLRILFIYFWIHFSLTNRHVPLEPPHKSRSFVEWPCRSSSHGEPVEGCFRPGVPKRPPAGRKKRPPTPRAVPAMGKWKSVTVPADPLKCPPRGRLAM